MSEAKEEKINHENAWMVLYTSYMYYTSRLFIEYHINFIFFLLDKAMYDVQGRI